MSELPPDPFLEGVPEYAKSVGEAGEILEALFNQRSFPELFRAVDALDDSERRRALLRLVMANLREQGGDEAFRKWLRGEL
jgi:hypothetical protein